MIHSSRIKRISESPLADEIVYVIGSARWRDGHESRSQNVSEVHTTNDRQNREPLSSVMHWACVCIGHADVPN